MVGRRKGKTVVQSSRVEERRDSFLRSREQSQGYSSIPCFYASREDHTEVWQPRKPLSGLKSQLEGRVQTTKFLWAGDQLFINSFFYASSPSHWTFFV